MVDALVYRPSPIKRIRRTRSQIDDLKRTILATIEPEVPVTLRGAFYLLVSAGAIEKTEAAYKRLGSLMVQMRRARELPFEWIVDNTRWMRKPHTYSDLGSMLRICRQTYRRALWESQSSTVEVWSEKDAICGAIFEVTSEWDVPLQVCRGYPSVTYLQAAAQDIEEAGKPAFVYYLGDHDPSGHDISRAVCDGLREFAPNADIEFERIAVTEQQIYELRLPTRPTKTTDSRSKNFEGESVEVDAIPANTLRAIVNQKISSHIDPGALEAMQRAEELERDTLDRVLSSLAVGGQPQ